jgi:hypothetical protein
MTTVGDRFPEEVERLRQEQARAREEERALRAASPAEFLRLTGWEQSHFPGRHRVAEERVWTHPRHAPDPITFGHALLLAGYRSRSRLD